MKPLGFIAGHMTPRIETRGSVIGTTNCNLKLNPGSNTEDRGNCLSKYLPNYSSTAWGWGGRQWLPILKQQAGRIHTIEKRLQVSICLCFQSRLDGTFLTRALATDRKVPPSPRGHSGLPPGTAMWTKATRIHYLCAGNVIWKQQKRKRQMYKL